MLLSEVAHTIERVRGAAMSPTIVRCSATHLKALLSESGAADVLMSTPRGWRLHGAPVIIEPRVEISIERGHHVESLPE